jgi:hypothetical protein
MRQYSDLKKDTVFDLYTLSMNARLNVFINKTE